MVTQDTNFLDVLSLSLSPGVTTYANSSKFSFTTTTTAPLYFYFFQWVTGHDTNQIYINYDVKLILNTNIQGSDFQIIVTKNYYRNTDFDGMKLIILLVSKTINNKGTMSFSTYKYGSSLIPSNFGAPHRYYGQQSTGRSCAMGLYSLSITFYNPQSYRNKQIAFVFL